MVMDCLKIKNDNLYIDDCNTTVLAAKYGTPLYVFSETSIRNAIRSYKNSIKKYYGGNGNVLYASKAFSCKEMYRIAKDEGIFVDCVSMGEIYTALSAEFNAEHIFFHGNNKTEEELKYALSKGVGRIVIDNFDELNTVDAISKELGIKTKVLIRITPGIDAHTHDYIKTGRVDSKFGFAITTGDAVKAIKETLKKENIELMGLHCHIGSQIFETEPFMDAATIMLKFIAEINKKFNIEIKELNLGGGFGIQYVKEDDPLEYPEFMKKVSVAVKETAKYLQLPTPVIYIEPGRSIVGPAGLTLYTIGNVKQIENVRNYVAVDGGMSDNPRYALYDADYSFVIANKADKQQNYLATIAGKCCESGDLLAEDVLIAKPKKGDILAVLATGAYNYSMASNYNRIPRPAVVMVNGNEDRLIIKRESLDDLVLNDL